MCLGTFVCRWVYPSGILPLAVDADAFTYTAEIRPPAWPADGFHFSVLSQWDGAKDPVTARTALQLTTDREGLLVLRGLIDRAAGSENRSSRP